MLLQLHLYAFLFQVVHRTLAAIIGSTCTLGVLSMLGKVNKNMYAIRIQIFSH